ncbi:unnamed protein product [Leptidea sinapis]|uniref:Uncharacterized protein n=1 Tax=Leptidea sinapis TaxID=189913 RepID=A0A5E4QI16_9NEOP|nr:unnamed protein product [Leptidea sinapis]
MSLKAYEDACLRAELFGQPKPDREEFLEKHKYLDVNEFEDVDIKISELLLTASLTVLSEPSYVGQTNFDKDFVAGTSSDFSTVNTGLGPKDNEMSMSAGKRQHGGDINTAIEDLKTMQKAENSFSFGGLLQ